MHSTGLLHGKINSTKDVMHAKMSCTMCHKDDQKCDACSSPTVRHEEGCNALLQHVFHFPLQPAPLFQACQDVALCQQMHVLPACQQMVMQRNVRQLQDVCSAFACCSVHRTASACWAGKLMFYSTPCRGGKTVVQTPWSTACSAILVTLVHTSLAKDIGGITGDWSESSCVSQYISSHTMEKALKQKKAERREEGRKEAREQSRKGSEYIFSFLLFFPFPFPVPPSACPRHSVQRELLDSSPLQCKVRNYRRHTITKTYELAFHKPSARHQMHLLS